MIEHDDVIERLQRFYGEVRAQQRATIPAWTPPGTPRWRQPLQVLAAVGLVLIAGVIAFALHDLRQHSQPIGLNPSASVASLPTALVTDAHVFNTLDGWALTQDGLYETLDGGATWTKISSPDMGSPAAAYFVDPAHGWAASQGRPGGTAANPESTYTVYRTVDGGKIWSRQDVAVHVPGFFQAGGVSLDFVDRKDGWLVAVNTTGMHGTSGELLRTVDGGATWTRLSRPDGLSPLPDGYPVRFVNPMTGWNVGSSANGMRRPDTLYVTRDGGVSWNPVPITIGAGLNGLFSLPTFVDASHGVLPVTIPPNTEHFYVTNDGGLTWSLSSSHTVGVLGNDRFSIQVPLPVAITGKLSWVEAWGRHLQVFGNGGYSSVEPIGFPLGGVDELDFVSNSVGWALTLQSGRCTGPTSCVVYRYVIRTTDGGHTWTPLNIP